MTQLGADGKPFDPKRWATWAVNPFTTSKMKFNRTQEPIARSRAGAKSRRRSSKIPCPHCFERVGRSQKVCPHCQRGIK